MGARDSYVEVVWTYGIIITIDRKDLIIWILKILKLNKWKELKS